jgi:SAM-dependent methyltransferase
VPEPQNRTVENDPASTSSGEVTPDKIFETATGFMAAKHLFVAGGIGLFEHLADDPATLDDLARRTGVPSRSVRILADAMVALGFLERDEGYYRNSPVAAAFLSGAGVADMRPFLRFWDRISYPAWARLDEAIRTRRSAFGELNAEQQRIFSEGVEAGTTPAARALAATYDFGRHRRVLDLGGGTGSFLIPMLERHAGLKATLFEMPAVAAIARARLADTPVAGRVEVAAGDFLRDPLPAGHDLVLVAQVIHLFSPERNAELLRRVREHVVPGARLLLVDMWTDPTHTQPLLAALLAAEFLAVTGEGESYSAEEAGSWLRETGWRTVEHTPLAGPASLIVAEAD